MVNISSIVKSNIKARKQKAMLSEELSAKGLAYNEFELLYVVSENPGMRSSDIANFIGQEKASVSRLLSILQNKGFVGIERPGDDRRVSIVKVTAKGKNAIKM